MAVTSRALKGIKKDRKIDNAEGAPVTCLAVPTTCSELLDELERTRAACITRGLVPVFHYTSPVVFRMTITSGFRMSALFVYGAKPSVLGAGRSRQRQYGEQAHVRGPVVVEL